MGRDYKIANMIANLYSREDWQELREQYEQRHNLIPKEETLEHLENTKLRLAVQAIQNVMIDHPDEQASLWSLEQAAGYLDEVMKSLEDKIAARKAEFSNVNKQAETVSGRLL